MFKIVRFLLIFAITVMFVAPVPKASSAAEDSAAVILFLEGDVKVRKVETVDWIKAKSELELFVGDSVRTDDDSWVEIAFGKNYKNVVRIGESTDVNIDKLGPVKLNLLEGEIRSLIESLDEGSTFEIKTPAAICGARGTGWDTDVDDGEVKIDVYEATVYFNKGFNVKAGKRCEFDDPYSDPVFKKVSAGDIADWKKWKADFKKRLAALLSLKLGKNVEKINQKILDKQRLMEKLTERTDRIMQMPMPSPGVSPGRGGGKDDD